ncbi:MAG: hypothetical protein R2716_07700 [Microthrixaceae bacterium]
MPHPELGEEVKAAAGDGSRRHGHRRRHPLVVAEALGGQGPRLHPNATTASCHATPRASCSKNVLRGEGHVSFAETM